MSLYYWDHAAVSAVRKMQLRKFRQLFEYARQHSKFYREYYGDHGVSDLKIECYADIAKVPSIDKSILRSHETRNIMTRDIDGHIQIHSTSGSSGEPFQVAFDRFAYYSAHVRLVKALMAGGYHPFKKALLLSRYDSGHHFEIEEEFVGIGFLQKQLGLFRRELISVFAPVEAIIRKIEEMKPFVVWSTPSIMEIIARELKKTGRKLDIPLVLFMSENLSPEFLESFKERIGREYIDLYGCMESPSIGYGSNQVENKKVFANSTMVEVVNRGFETGRVIGDVIITNLVNRTMPLIRFDLGDRVEVLGQDNSPFRTIGRLHGRSDDIIYFGDRYTLAHHHSYQLFRDFHECLQYKFIEKAGGVIVLQLRVDESVDRESVKTRALQRWSEKYPDYPLTIEWKEEFAIDRRTGKFKVIEKYLHTA